MNVGCKRKLDSEGYDKHVWLCDWENCVNNTENRETINHFDIVKFTEFQLAIFNLTLYSFAHLLETFSSLAYIFTYIYFSVKSSNLMWIICIYYVKCTLSKYEHMQQLTIA